jgi:A nuclease family of the HNH/ENDO VII superfamily with conserved AHH
MTELGELIAPPQFVQDDVHSESTCPWHDSAKPPAAAEMDPAADNEDASSGRVLQPMAANNGKKLGVNLGGKENTRIKVSYPGSASPKEEDLQWAPHHLIPGNASLKNSAVVPYLGASNVIKAFGSGSKIKDGQTVGYDVNDAANGVWLPSPYALSMKGKWPTDPAGKNAYVEAAIDSTGGSRQFHMCHGTYSNSVREVLEEIGEKLKLITTNNVCPKAKAQDSDKFDAPLGLKPRLNAVSSRLRRITSGPVWQPPFTDDTLVPAYVAKKGIKKTAGLVADGAPIGIGTG